MAGRRIRNEREAREALIQVAKAGVGRVDWARKGASIPGRSMPGGSTWRGATAASVRPSVSSSWWRSPCAAASTVVHVRCGPFVVDVTADVDDRLLARVLAAVASC
jgi:hypothetical protein